MVANKTSVQSYTSVPLHVYLSLSYASSLIQIKDGQQELCWSTNGLSILQIQLHCFHYCVIVGQDFMREIEQVKIRRARIILRR